MLSGRSGIGWPAWMMVLMSVESFSGKRPSYIHLKTITGVPSVGCINSFRAMKQACLHVSLRGCDSRKSQKPLLSDYLLLGVSAQISDFALG